MSAFDEIENKVRVVIFGLFGSVMACFSVTLGVSILTSDRWTIVTAGIIVGIAGSLANAVSPFVSRTSFLRPSISFRAIVRQSASSFFATFAIIFLSIISYLLMESIIVARITSLVTGMVMLFIFGIHRAEMENRENSIAHAFGIVFLGATAAALSFVVARYYILQ